MPPRSRQYFNHKELNKHHDDRVNFVTICRQKIDRRELPMDFDKWTVKKQLDHFMSNIDKYFPNTPASLRFILPGTFQDGDCGRSASEKPDWLDLDKFRHGQKFAQNYCAGIFIAQMMSVLQLLTFEDVLKTMILSQKSDTPYEAFKRYLSTMIRVKHWYLEDPWDQGTRAHKDIQEVRNMHLAMRRKLCNCDHEQIDASSQILQLYCPLQEILVKDFRDSCPVVSDPQCPFRMTRIKGLSQTTMSITQSGFMGMIVLYPEKFGLHNVCDEDLEAFCHMWRGLGYLLGIEDRYNFCNGSLQDVRKRVKDSLEYYIKPNLSLMTPDWEHMSICFLKGLRYYIPIYIYRIHLIHFCDIIELDMPRLYKSLSLKEKAIYLWMNFLLKYLTKLPIVVTVMNAMLLKYLNLAANFRRKTYRN